MNLNEPKKTINVVAAIIMKDNRLFATQRGYGEWKDWWEFPGGKIEGKYEHGDDGACKWIPMETPQDALKREIREELQTEIEVGELLTTVEYDYPAIATSNANGFHLSMQCFLCSIISGNLTLQEHEDARWLTKGELDSVKWLPADLEILPLIAERLRIR